MEIKLTDILEAEEMLDVVIYRTLSDKLTLWLVEILNDENFTIGFAELWYGQYETLFTLMCLRITLSPYTVIHPGV